MLGEEGWRNLKTLPALMSLRVGGPKVSLEGVGHLRALSGLQVLRLHDVASPAGLEELRDLRCLRTLWLEAMPLGDAEMRTIGTMSWLQELSLRQTQVTDAGVIVPSGGSGGRR